MNLFKSLCILGMFVFFFNIQALAIGDDSQTRQSLHGIKKVYIEIDKQGLDNRLNLSLITEDIIAKLRPTTIRVSEEKQSADAVIHVSITGVPAGDNIILYNVYVEIYQMVQTVNSTQRPSLRGYAATWGTASIGKVANQDMPQLIRTDINGLIDIFLSAHALTN